MKNRRNFFKNLFGFLIAPKVAEVAEVVKVSAINPISFGSKGKDVFIYAPYIPLLTTKQLLLQNMSRQIQEEIDSSLLENMKIEIDASLTKTIKIT